MSASLVLSCPGIFLSAISVSCQLVSKEQLLPQVPVAMMSYLEMGPETHSQATMDYEF